MSVFVEAGLYGFGRPAVPHKVAGGTSELTMVTSGGYVAARLGQWSTGGFVVFARLRVGA